MKIEVGMKKIDAKIKWLIDAPQLGIEIGKIENVKVNAVYAEPDVLDITNWIENELAEKYGATFTKEDGDFMICNMLELLEELDYDEFHSKVDPCHAN